MQITRTSMLGVTLVLAAVVAATAQPADPALGTWKLNVAKSKFDPGPPPQSATLTIEAAGQGIHVTTSGVAANGNKTATEYTANYDGKDYPITGSSASDHVSLKRIDARTSERTDKKEGKTVATIRRVVAPDGKTMTITTKATNAQGQPVNNVVVYEKQ
jgi:hypothetical protein